MSFQRHDNVPDSPTNTFATLSPLSGNIDPTDGNLKIAPSNAHSAAGTTMFVNSGKWYVEYYGASWSNHPAINFYTPATPYNAIYTNTDSTDMWYWRGSGHWSTAGYNTANTGFPTWSSGEIVGVLLDYDNDGIFGFVNGSAVNSGNKLFSTSILNKSFGITIKAYDGTHYINYGQDPTFGGTKNTPATVTIDGQSVTGPFAPSGTAAGTAGLFYYPPPADALALCTANLPDPDIDPAADDLPEDYFIAVKYTGQTNAGAYNNGAVTVGFQPDLVWIKQRDTYDGTNSYNHYIYDSVRGTGHSLQSNSTNQQETTRAGLTSFSQTGFSLGTQAGENASGKSYISWVWKAGGAPSGSTSTTGSAKRINTSGTQDDTSCDALASAASATITPTLMSINQKAGFSIVLATGFPYTSGTSATIPHGLSKTPELTIFKNLDVSDNWYIRSEYSSSLLALNLTWGDSNYPNYWSTRPFNSDILTIASSGFTSSSTQRLIFYNFHSVAGYSAFGSYTGNGSADGPFVYTGFKPAWVMIKETGNAGSWHIYDNSRPNYNPASYLLANESVQEDDYGSYGIDILSNGYKVRNSGNGTNRPSGIFIYAAFAEMPTKYATAR